MSRILVTIKTIKAEPGVKTAKRIANNTAKIVYSNGSTAYRLYYTDVVTYTRKGKLILNTGGHFTVTTKNRINRFLPKQLKIQQINYTWYLMKWTGKKWIKTGRRFEGNRLAVND